MSLERKKHSPEFRRGTRTSPSRSCTAVVILLVRRSSLVPRSQIVVPRLAGQACTTILQLHKGSILEAAKAVACPFMHTCIPMSRTKSQFTNGSEATAKWPPSILRADASSRRGCAYYSLSHPYSANPTSGSDRQNWFYPAFPLALGRPHWPVSPR